MPQDENYPAEAANKLKQNYLVVDYKDVYNDINKNIYMTYSYKILRAIIQVTALPKICLAIFIPH